MDSPHSRNNGMFTGAITDDEFRIIRGLEQRIAGIRKCLGGYVNAGVRGE